MVRRSLVTGIVSLGVLLVACSGEDDGEGVTLESACDNLVQALCSKVDECFSLGLKVQYHDVAECTSRQKQSCLKSFAAPGTSAKPEAANACADAYGAASCADVLAGLAPEACRIAGSLADGAPCGEAAQCKGSNCRKTAGNACGACSTRAAAGGPCSANDDCDYGLACGGETCVARGSAGAPCSGTQPCAANLACAKGACVETLAAGAACDPAGDACDRLKGLYCDRTSKVCKVVKLANPGETCGVVDGTFVICAAAGKCKAGAGAQGTCEAAAADGQACDDAKGPACIEPAECTNGVCTIADPAACK